MILETIEYKDDSRNYRAKGWFQKLQSERMIPETTERKDGSGNYRV